MRRPYTRSEAVLPVAPDPDPDMAALLQASVLYRDDHILVLNKPSGLAVHPGPRTPESLELYLPFLGFDRKRSPQPAHRLDRDTSGCLVLGRTPGSVRQLSSWFSERAIAKSYLAVVDGVPIATSGCVTQPLLKTSSAEGGWRMIVSSTGQTAITRWRMLTNDTVNSLLLLQPETGRTHQLRVHCATMGCPIAGDPVYGRSREDNHMYLHAYRISLPRIQSENALVVTAPLPDSWPPQFSIEKGIGE